MRRFIASFIIVSMCALLFTGCESDKTGGDVVMPNVVVIDTEEPSAEPTVEVTAEPTVVPTEEQDPDIDPNFGKTPEENPGDGTTSQETDIGDGTITSDKKHEPVEVHGIYVTGSMAGTKGMQNLISLAAETEINAMVIDIKNDDGRVTYKMDSPYVNELGSAKNLIPDLDGVLTQCKENDIYLIARIVTFCDNYATEVHPEWAVKTKDGSVYKDNRKLGWLNPYNRDCWPYIAEVAVQAAQAGFDEIQFDYIRLSTDKKMKDLDYGEESQTVTSQEIISEFCAYIMEQLEPYGVYVSADVYGTIIGSEIDRKNVGQNYVDMCSKLDYICPMIYPSHYANGNFGIDIPDTDPYGCIKGAMDLSTQELSVLEGQHCAIVRPWLQAFTATWVKGHIEYNEEEIRAQIQAVYDAGYKEWILWNSGNVYKRGALNDAE